MKQIGTRCAQADLDHAVGHRDHFIDRAEGIADMIGAPGTKLAIEQPGDVARLDRAAVGPFVRPEPEDVTQAVIADVPALGQTGLDLSVRVEADEALGDVLKKHGIACGQRPRGRVNDPGSRSDHRDLELAPGILVARRG